jgi:hypothetical protein
MTATEPVRRISRFDRGKELAQSRGNARVLRFRRQRSQAHERLGGGIGSQPRDQGRQERREQRRETGQFRGPVGSRLGEARQCALDALEPRQLPGMLTADLPQCGGEPLLVRRWCSAR